MPRKALGDHPLSAAERQARQRLRNAAQTQIYLSQLAAMHKTLEQVREAKTLRGARRIALEALYHSEYG